MDEKLWPDQAIAQMYARRWSIEICFRHLKTTLKMDMLKCQSVEGVLKELAVYLIVYNMVRLGDAQGGGQDGRGCRSRELYRRRPLPGKLPRRPQRRSRTDN